MASNHLFAAKKVDYNYEFKKTIDSFEEDEKKKIGLLLASYGLSCAGKDKIYDKKIHSFDLGFYIDKNVKYEEGRVLFYSLVDNLLKKFNENKALKEFFHHYPMGYEDLFFRLSFDYLDKGYLKKGDLYQICILENQIMYFFVAEDGKGPENVMGKSTDGFSVGYHHSNLRTIVRTLPEDPETAKYEK